MKTLLYLSTSCLLMALISCHEDNSFSAIKRIVNETQYTVDFRVFGDDLEFTYKMNPFDTLEMMGKCEGAPTRVCNFDWTSSLSKSEFIFDNEKILTFQDQCAEGAAAISWDPFECSDHGSLTIENGINVYTYSITQSDYDNAELISN